MSNIDAARQRQKEDELAKLKRKREKARMQRDYNRIYKECAARQKRIVRNVTFRHSRLDLPLEEWEEEHGLGDLDYGWARHRKQRMQPVTDERQLLNYQSVHAVHIQFLDNLWYQHHVKYQSNHSSCY